MRATTMKQISIVMAACAVLLTGCGSELTGMDTAVYEPKAKKPKPVVLLGTL